MGALEKYLHTDPAQTPPLLKAALSHVQFETIHPFLDGNGRVGRLLITFLLCHEGVLQQPLLYVSLFLKQHRKEYYDYLQRVRTEGAWEEWLAFFFQGVATTADQAADTARRILRLFQEDQRRIAEAGAAPSVARVHELLQRQPMLSVKRARALLQDPPTFVTVNSAFSNRDPLVELERMERTVQWTWRESPEGIFSAGGQPAEIKPEKVADSFRAVVALPEEVLGKLPSGVEALSIRLGQR
jgi:Fic family protein